MNVYEWKGGDRYDTKGPACISDALRATVGLPQARAVARFLKPGASEYSAADVIATPTAGL